MKLTLSPSRAKAFSLLLVMFLLGIGFLLMTGVMRWSEANRTLAGRHSDHFTSLAAAEAATEKVLASLSRDFQNFGVPGVDANLSAYGNSYPTTAELAEWGQYEFRNPQGGNNSTYVVKLSDEEYTGLNWKYSGFGGYAASYRIISNARRLVSGNNVAGVRQDVQSASIPLFEFAIFYAVDMEFNPMLQDFRVTGPVHCNGSIYCEPDQHNVTFADHVTAAQRIVHDNHPNDSWNRIFGSVTYLGYRDSGVTSLNLPIGTTNTPQALHSIIEIPPTAESPTSLMGKQRYYNKADLIILVSNTTVVAKSGLYNGFATTIPWTNGTPPYMSAFLKTNATFYNKRESKTIRATEINIGQMNAQYGALTTLLGREPRIIYVGDMRAPGGGEQIGVRLVGGTNLPPNGLTVATRNPLYVKGHYNAVALGSTNTSQTKPASLIADAITILSPNWNDGNGGNPISGRPAVDTTVNAAIIAGIVPSEGGVYSGGVENFFRLLEDWGYGSKVLTFNGSIVVLYQSQIATAPWDINNVYSPPIRSCAFDVNFKTPAKLPPGTPQLRTLIRNEWTVTRAGSTL